MTIELAALPLPHAIFTADHIKIFNMISNYNSNYYVLFPMNVYYVGGG